MDFMRVLSPALAAASLTWFGVACSFTSSGSGGTGASPVESTSATPLNGHPSTPEQVDCNGSAATGTELCTVSSQEGCCASGSGAGSCDPDNGTTTCNGTGQWFFECDEAADCNAGEVCCLVGTTFSCATSCAGGLAAQSCRLSSECGEDGGGACIVQTCNGGIFAELCQLGDGCTAAP
jgi:hypothetical protein